MTLNDRQNDMLKLVESEKRVSVKKLAAQFFVSEMTVRRDLKLMEEAGYIQRYNGGAVFSGEYITLPIEFRKLLHTKEKISLSEKTKKYFHDGMTVFIDSSSTCLYVINKLAEYKNIKILTNSVQALVAASKLGIKCVFAGGEYYAHDMCTVGCETVEYMKGKNTDIGFFSSQSISQDGTISDSDGEQTAVRKAALEGCKVKIFLFAKDKQSKKCLYTLCKAKDADEIIIM